MAQSKAKAKQATGTPQTRTAASFFEDLLFSLVKRSSIEAAQVWGLNSIGALAKIACSNVERFKSFEQPEIVERHRDLISKALFSGKVQVVEFQESNQVQLVTKRLMLAPIFLEQESVGVFELIMTHKPTSSDQQFIDAHVREASQFLSQRSQPPQSVSGRDYEPSQPTVSDPDKKLHSTQDTRERDVAIEKSLGRESNRKYESKSNARLDLSKTDSGKDFDSCFDVEAFVLLLNNQNDLDYVAATATTEARRLAGCDRVSLATSSGGPIKVAAVSGQDELSKKSNMIRAVEQLAAFVVDSGREVVFDPTDRETENRSLDLAATYIEESGASWIRAIPLFEPEKIDFDSNVHHSNKTAIGVLLLEQFNSREMPNYEMVERLTPHVAQAVYHAVRQEGVFLLPARRRLGGFVKKAKLTRVKTMVASGLAIAVVAALALVQVPYQVEAAGKLMPVQKFRAYSPFDGQVENVLVTSGQRVQRNQPLIQLTSESLNAKHLSLTNSLIEKTKLLGAYKAQLNETSAELSNAALISLNTKIVQLGLEIEGLQQQLELQKILLDRSLIRSSIDGSVATFQPGEVLASRPVGRGDLLLEVMNEEADWQLELLLPEKRLGHLVDQIANSQESLKVKFVQATASEDEYDAEVDSVATRLEVSESGVAGISIYASIDSSQNIRKTIGAEVIAKIDCGKRSLGYVWFGDILDWMRQTSWRLN